MVALFTPSPKVCSSTFFLVTLESCLLFYDKVCLSFQKEMKALSLVVQEAEIEPEAKGRWKDALPTSFLHP